MILEISYSVVSTSLTIGSCREHIPNNGISVALWKTGKYPFIGTEFLAGHMGIRIKNKKCFPPALQRGVARCTCSDKRNTAEVKCGSFWLFSFQLWNADMVATKGGPCRPLWGQWNNKVTPSVNMPHQHGVSQGRNTPLFCLTHDYLGFLPLVYKLVF